MLLFLVHKVFLCWIVLYQKESKEKRSYVAHMMT